MPLIELGIKTLKFKRTLSALKVFLKKQASPPENEQLIVGRYTNFLYFYHRKFPYLGKCLARSLALWFLLKRKGIETNLKFGMKKKEGKFLAHAWIEYKGEALISQAEIEENYIPFDESILTEFSK